MTFTLFDCYCPVDATQLNPWYVLSVLSVLQLTDILAQNNRHDGYEALATDGTQAPSEEASLNSSRLNRSASNTAHFTISPDGQRYTYAYGPGGIAGLRANPYTLLSALFASIGGLLFGYDQGVIANVLVMREFRGKFGLSEWEEGVVSECEFELWFWFGTF